MLTNSPLQHWTNTTLEVLHKIDNHTQTWWMCLSLSQKAYLATPLPLTWEAPENLKTKTSVLIGPLATGIHLTNADNLTCTVPEGMNGTSLYGRNITLKRNTTLCSIPGVFYLCSNSAYWCLEANWTQICYSVFLTPEISVYTEDQLLTAFSPKSQAKLAILLPVLIGEGIGTGIGTGIGGIGSSCWTTPWTISRDKWRHGMSGRFSGNLTKPNELCGGSDTPK